MIKHAIEQLTINAERIRTLVSGVSDEQAKWRPDDASWSLLETVTHLHDEEREDFRVRLNYMLNKPDQEWPPIDPMGWVTSRKYNERRLADSLAGFLEERQKSIAWLKALKEPNLDAVVQAPWGEFPAGSMLAGWVAHDLLHIRQLVELLYAYEVGVLRPYSPRYAGEW